MGLFDVFKKKDAAENTAAAPAPAAEKAGWFSGINRRSRKHRRSSTRISAIYLKGPAGSLMMSS